MKRPKLMLAIAFALGVLVGVGLMLPLQATIAVDLPPAVEPQR